MIQIYFRGQVIAEFESQGPAQSYVQRSPFRLQLEARDSTTNDRIQFLGRLTDRESSLQEIMTANKCTRSEARKLLAESEGSAVQPPGRPPLESTKRVREIMIERKCSYGTAYATFRRELAGVASPRRPVGRPMLGARELASELGCDEVRAAVLIDEAENELGEDYDKPTRRRMAIRVVRASHRASAAERATSSGETSSERAVTSTD